MASSSIVRSRKRKLRELYAVATDGDGALNLNKFDVDAPPTKPGETKFLLDTDILQYVPTINSVAFITAFLPGAGRADTMLTVHLQRPLTQ